MPRPTQRSTKGSREADEHNGIETFSSRSIKNLAQALYSAG